LNVFKKKEHNYRDKEKRKREFSNKKEIKKNLKESEYKKKLELKDNNNR
jgi:hypothetical protein